MSSIKKLLLICGYDESRGLSKKLFDYSIDLFVSEVKCGFFTCALVPFALRYVDNEACIMKALKTRFLKLILAVLIILLVIWIMSVLKCEMAPPAY